MPVLGVVLPGQPDGNVATVAGVDDLNLEVVVAGADRGLGLKNRAVVKTPTTLQSTYDECQSHYVSKVFDTVMRMGSIRTIQTIPHNLLVSVKLTSLRCELMLKIFMKKYMSHWTYIFWTFSSSAALVE